MPIIIDKSKCPQSHKCPAALKCPVQALTQDGFSAPEVNQEICRDCGLCVKICPMGALRQE